MRYLPCEECSNIIIEDDSPVMTDDELVFCSESCLEEYYDYDTDNIEYEAVSLDELIKD